MFPRDFLTLLCYVLQHYWGSPTWTLMSFSLHSTTLSPPLSDMSETRVVSGVPLFCQLAPRCLTSRWRLGWLHRHPQASLLRCSEGKQAASVQGQTVNGFSFSRSTVSVTSTQLRHCRVIAATDNAGMNGCGCCHIKLFTKTDGKIDLAHRLQSASSYE